MSISDQRKIYNREYQERTHRIAVTLTPTEYRELTARAKAEGVRTTTLVKNMAIAYHHGQNIMPDSVRVELQELRFLLRNVTNNINQIAHHSNIIRSLVDENGLLLEIQKMEQMIHDFVNKKLKP
jgi:hypothetical protein